MGDRKRKRGRKPKTPVPETLELENSTPSVPGSGPSSIPTTPATATDAEDGVFNVNNVELIDSHNRRRRGRPKKKNKLPSSDQPASSAKPLKVASPTHILLDKPNGPASLMGVSGADTAAAVARVVPAMDAVVKVFCVHTEPNFSLPWQRKRQYSSSSSGFVIKGRRVLTNAHSVEHYTQVKLKKRGSDTKYVATVLAIGTECDIGKGSISMLLFHFALDSIRFCMNFSSIVSILPGFLDNSFCLIF